MELEADNAGITETLELKCLKEMAAHPQVSLNNHKSDRRKDGSRRKGRPGGADSGGASAGKLKRKNYLFTSDLTTSNLAMVLSLLLRDPFSHAAG